MSIHELVRALEGSERQRDSNVAVVASVLRVAERAYSVWSRCTPVLVDTVSKQAAIVGRCDPVHVLQDLEDTATYVTACLRGADPAAHPSFLLATLGGGKQLLLYKTLCLDWVAHRFSIRVDVAPIKLYRLLARRHALKNMPLPAYPFAMTKWAAVVQLTATREASCTVCGLLAVGGSFAVCGKCRVFRYCSKTCQKAHWKDGHKAKCGEYRTTEGESYDEFNAFVAAYGTDDVDDLAKATYKNAATEAREAGVTANDAVSYDVFRCMTRLQGL